MHRVTYTNEGSKEAFLTKNAMKLSEASLSDWNAPAEDYWDDFIN